MSIGDFEPLLASKDLLQNYIADCWASIFCEIAFKKFYAQINERYKKQGFYVSPEYSPGYEGFDLSNQKTIFKILLPEQIEISLSSSFIMTPAKSVSGIIGIASEDIFHYHPPCERCTIRENCKQKKSNLCGISFKS